LYDEILDLNDHKYKLEFWKLLSNIAKGRTVLLRVLSKLFIDKNHRYYLRLKSVMTTEILVNFKSCIILYNRKRLNSYVKNIEHYLEFFANISEEKDFAMILVSIDLTETIFDYFCQSSGKKNFNSPFDQVPSKKIHPLLATL